MKGVLRLRKPSGRLKIAHRSAGATEAVGGKATERSISRLACKIVEPRTHWQKAENYHTVELIFDGNNVIYKDWWDPGHDPNRTEVSIAEFLGGALHAEIERELGRSVLDEALANVELLTSGGPGVAEPPD